MSSKEYSFLERLENEEPPGHWGFFVYSTYSPDAKATYLPILPLKIRREIEETTDNNHGSVANEKPSIPFDKFVVRRFQGYIDSYIHFNIEEPYDEQTWEALDLDYFRLPSASTSQACEHFRSNFPPGHYGLRYQMLIIIDDECLKSILEGPAPVLELKNYSFYADETRGETNIFVKLVDAAFDEDYGGIRLDTGSRSRGKNLNDGIIFPGWIKVSPRDLIFLWEELKAYGWRGAMNMIYKGPDSLYDVFHMMSSGKVR